MFYNFRIAMDTVDWNADIRGAPAWRYIYHTLHSVYDYCSISLYKVVIVVGVQR